MLWKRHVIRIPAVCQSILQYPLILKPDKEAPDQTARIYTGTSRFFCLTVRINSIFLFCGANEALFVGACMTYHKVRIAVFYNARKGPVHNLRTTQALISLSFRADWSGLRCPLIESMNTVVYVDEQRMSGSDCTDAHAHLALRCSHVT